MTHEHRRPRISLYNFNGCAAGQQPACPHRILKFACYKHLLSYNEFLDFFRFSDLTGARSFSKHENQNENQKTPKTRPERPSFRNGLGTVPGVYEATTIAHRTPPALAGTMVGGTFGVFETFFFGRNIDLPSLYLPQGSSQGYTYGRTCT